MKTLPEEKLVKTEEVIDLTIPGSPESEDDGNQGRFAADGSPIFRNQSVTLSDAAEILLDTKPGHGLPCARHVPQMGAKDLPAVTFS